MATEKLTYILTGIKVMKNCDLLLKEYACVHKLL